MKKEDITLDSLINDGKNFKREMFKITYGYQHRDNEAFRAWLQTAKRFISYHYTGDIVVDEFEKEIINYGKSWAYPSSMDSLIGVLISCKHIPDVVKPKTNPSNIGTQINMSNSQSQEQLQQQFQSAEIFLEAIKDDLTGRQIKELKQIVEEEEGDLAKAKPKLLDKLRSFGLSVTSNIIANIITNPSVWARITQ